MIVLYDVPFEVEIVHIEVGASVKLREYFVYSAAITFKHLIRLFLSLGYRLKDGTTLALLHSFLLVHKPVGASHKLVYIFNTAHRAV